MSFSLTLPYPPSVNRYYRHPTRGPLAGRHLISEDGRKYREAVFAAVADQKATRCLSGPLRVSFALCPPDYRRRDLDNTTKALLDSLTHAGVWVDDSQIKRLVLEWDEVERGGKVFASIEEIQ